MQRTLALLLLVASVPAGAEIYKWTDENGRVHFGDSAAGAGRKTEAVAPSASSTGAPATSGAAAGEGAAGGDAEQMKQRQRRLLDTLQRERAEKEAAEKRQAEFKRRQDAECRRTRNMLQDMQGRALYTTGEDGQRNYLDDTQRQAHLDSISRYLEQYCQ